LKINPLYTCGDILTDINKQHDNCFAPLEDHAIVFYHIKFGEKILDAFECPLQILKNCTEESGFFKNIASKVFSSRKVQNSQNVKSIITFLEKEVQQCFFI
jgi:hypothetical protein